MKNKLLPAFFISCFYVTISFAQYATVYPANWWAGMKWNKVQLIIRGENDLGKEKVNISYPGITITKTHKFDNGKYLAVDITISPAAKPGTVNIISMQLLLFLTLYNIFTL